MKGIKSMKAMKAMVTPMKLMTKVKPMKMGSSMASSKEILCPLLMNILLKNLQSSSFIVGGLTAGLVRMVMPISSIDMFVLTFQGRRELWSSHPTTATDHRSVEWEYSRRRKVSGAMKSGAPISTEGVP